MSKRTHHPFRLRVASVHAGTRFVSAVLVSIAVALVLRHHVTSEVLAVAAWDSFALVATALTWTTILTLEPAQICTLAQREDPSRLVALILVVLGALSALLAVLLLLQQTKTMQSGEKPQVILLALSAVALAWLLIHTVFTLRYAHLFYDANAGELPIDFPGDVETPDYLDFAYFAFVIGMTAQTADVSIRGRRIRRTVLMHGIVSYFFNTAVIALSIGILTTLLA